MLRIGVFSVVVSVYALLIPLEYWRSQDPQPASRWIAIALSLLQALFYALRIPLADQFVFPVPPEDVNMFVPVWITGLCLHIAGMAFLVMVMVKERLELQLRRAALIDPLTGIANRPRLLRSRRTNTFALEYRPARPPPC